MMCLSCLQFGEKLEGLFLSELIHKLHRDSARCLPCHIIYRMSLYFKDKLNLSTELFYIVIS